MRRVFVFMTIWVSTFPLIGNAQTSRPEETFPTSLHGSRIGKITWYSAPNGGFEAITGIPISSLGCLRCHPGTKADGSPIDPRTYRPDCSDCHVRYGDTPPDAVCLKCHRRQASEIAFGYPDVHRQIGFACVHCHTEREMHGDGRVYTSWLEPGAMDISCEQCHRSVEPLPVHKTHVQTVDCEACHTRTVLSCYNCHFESNVLAGINRPYGVFRDFVLLLRRAGEGKVYTGTLMALTYGGNTFLAIAPYRSHTIVRKARECGDCHGNAAVTEYAQTGRITLVRWDPQQRRLIGPSGVIPVPPDWRQALQVDFVTYLGDPRSPQTAPGLWAHLKKGADLMQMLFAEPLTSDQMAKLRQPR